MIAQHPVCPVSSEILYDRAGSGGGRAASTLPPWFLILTKPAGESTASVNLERQGYRVYYPRLLRPTLSRGKWRERIVALFPRYLFVQLSSLSQSLAPVKSTMGVASIVCFGSRTAEVPPAIVERLQRRANPETGLHVLNRERRFQRGCAVKIIAGTFEGLEGVFERDGADERIVVLLNLLGAVASVRVPDSFVVPCRI